MSLLKINTCLIGWNEVPLLQSLKSLTI